MQPSGFSCQKTQVGHSFLYFAPKYRSQLRLINLAIVATAPVIEKHGLDKILQPFIDDLNTLAIEGITFPVNGILRTFLLAFLADNLASNDLGGFKMSFSFSFRCCRTCLATKDSGKAFFVSEKFKKRTDGEHREHVKLLNGPSASHYSKTYGINKSSSLLNVKHFSMFGGGLPHDAMHDILEGIVPLRSRFCCHTAFLKNILHWMNIIIVGC